MQIQKISRDIALKLPMINIDTVFDVGANVGQSIDEFITIFPNASIYAFEPIPSSFDQLKENFSDRTERIKLFHCALSNQNGYSLMTNRPLSPTNQIVNISSKPTREIQVQTQRGDDVLRSLGLNSVSYLKIDTEGHDLSVLEGFHDSLSNNLITFIQVETGLNPENKWHVPFENIKSLLESYNFRLFSLINVAWERNHLPFLRRCDAVFVSKTRTSANASE